MKWMLSFAILFSLSSSAQHLPDAIYMPSIKTVKFFQQGNQESLPILTLNSDQQLELHFDDLTEYAKNYYYTFELCNADWTPADVSVFDYLQGYQNQQLTQYRPSTITLSKYVHYQALLPDKNCKPIKSGNYILRVFLDSDTSKLAFTKRFFVVENKSSVNAQVLSPFDNQLVSTHQKLQFSVNATQLNPQNPQQQVKVVVLQNYRWDNALTNLQPSFMRNNVLEYNGEADCLFPAGKEYRWADLRSFRFESERISKIDRSKQPYEIYLKPEGVFSQLRYLYYHDYNGWFDVSVTESVNPWWQSDYGNVHFTFIPPNHQPFAGKDMYILGELTGNDLTDNAKMLYDADNGVYEKTLLLKQGYYFYTYVTRDQQYVNSKADASLTDGNYWETENDYTVFVYYRSLSDRYDELVAVATVNSRQGRAL